MPVAVSLTDQGFDDAVGTMTKYRRIIRRPNADNESLKIIFNDYMNCLWGHPTAAEEFPLIDAAAEAGCEYFCIDAGWYADGDWWDAVGDWRESKKRFPNGVREITDYIRSKGMIPGVWLELEVMVLIVIWHRRFLMTGFSCVMENVYMIEVDISLTTEIQKFVPMQIV